MKSLLKRLRRGVREVTSFRRRVDFFVCGTQKGGTTALDTYLRAHPEICMANRKEVHFFDKEGNFSGGKPDYSKYHSVFSPQDSHRLLGEATPIYMYWHAAPRRIWEYNREAKLIVLLRNPIERAYSHWNMERSRNADTLSFWDAIQSERERVREALPFQHRVYSYVCRGFYLEQLRKLWMFFPEDQVLVLKSEFLRKHPVEALREVTDFLEVGRVEHVGFKDVFSLPYDSQMSEREREYLLSVFENEILGIEKALGWDCSDWLGKEISDLFSLEK